MNWIKDVIVDILVTLFMVIAFWLTEPWMWWVLAIYTLLLLIVKGAVLMGEGFLRRGQKSQQAPSWFLHLLYAINIILLALTSWWYLFASWTLIWLFSFLGERDYAKG